MQITEQLLAEDDDEKKLDVIPNSDETEDFLIAQPNDEDNRFENEINPNGKGQGDSVCAPNYVPFHAESNGRSNGYNHHNFVRNQHRVYAPNTSFQQHFASLVQSADAVPNNQEQSTSDDHTAALPSPPPLETITDGLYLISVYFFSIICIYFVCFSDDDDLQT